jgi:hypothetical protein
MIGQQHFINSLLKPSGLGDLSFGRSSITSFISFSEKGLSKEANKLA